MKFIISNYEFELHYFPSECQMFLNTHLSSCRALLWTSCIAPIKDFDRPRDGSCRTPARISTTKLISKFRLVHLACAELAAIFHSIHSCSLQKNFFKGIRNLVRTWSNWLERKWRTMTLGNHRIRLRPNNEFVIDEFRQPQFVTGIWHSNVTENSLFSHTNHTTSGFWISFNACYEIIVIFGRRVQCTSWKNKKIGVKIDSTEENPNSISSWIRWYCYEFGLTGRYLPGVGECHEYENIPNDWIFCKKWICCRHVDLSSLAYEKEVWLLQPLDYRYFAWRQWCKLKCIRSMSMRANREVGIAFNVNRSVQANRSAVMEGIGAKPKGRKKIKTHFFSLVAILSWFLFISIFFFFIYKFKALCL